MSKEKTTTPTGCTCWTERNKMLEAHGLRISGACEMFTMKGLDLRHTCCLPLQRLDRRPLKKSDAKSIIISFCPFCGKSMEADPVPEDVDCATCCGTGEVEIQSGPYSRRCKDCKGTGKNPA